MKKKHINIAVDEETHKEVKVLAILKGLTINQYVRELIKNGLKKDKKLLEKLK